MATLQLSFPPNLISFLLLICQLNRLNIKVRDLGWSCQADVPQTKAQLIKVHWWSRPNSFHSLNNIHTDQDRTLIQYIHSFRVFADSEI